MSKPTTQMWETGPTRNGAALYNIQVRCTGGFWQQRHIWFADHERGDYSDRPETSDWIRSIDWTDDLLAKLRPVAVVSAEVAA